MNILFIMIPMAVVLVIVAVAFFFWAANNKQFDDLDSPGFRILLDDEKDATMQQHRKRQNEKEKDQSDHNKT